MEICKIHTNLNVVDPLTKPLPRAKHDQHCYLLSMRWFSLEEETVMQQSNVSISLSFENQGINPVRDYVQIP